MNQSFIAQELLEVSSPLDPYCEIIPKEIYCETVIDILKAGTYSELAQANFKDLLMKGRCNPSLLIYWSTTWNINERYESMILRENEVGFLRG